ncbi:MAG: tetratricopeptide repeat protein [Thainema sp.]
MVQLDDIHAQNETAFYDLVVAIENSDRQLSLLLAVCDDASLQAELIDRYEAEVAPQFKPYRVTVQPDKPSIKSTLADQVAADDYLQQGGLAVFTVLGANRLFRLRFGAEKSQQEEFLGYLQWTREALRQYPYPIVLWLTSQVLTEISRKAPDFWSWRKSVFRFASRRSLVVPTQDLETFRPLLELPDGDEETTIPLSDLERLIEQTETNNPHDPLLASLYFEAGKILGWRTIEGGAQEYRAEQQRAINYFQKALNLFRQQETESVQIADCLHWLAYLYKSQGRYAQAEPLYVEALAMSKQLLGEQHPDVASSLNNLAGLYRSQGRYEEAEPLYVEALAMRKQLLGEQHPDVASSLNNLAGLYRSQGRYEEAEPLYVEALAMSKQLLGEQHPDVASSLNNLAGLYRSQGRYEEAEPLYVKAVELFSKLLGDAHPHTRTVLENLQFFVQQVISSGQESILSDHPLIQRIVQTIKTSS